MSSPPDHPPPISGDTSQYSITLHNARCLHCQHTFEYTTFIVRTGSNSYQMGDTRNLPSGAPNVLFTLDVTVPRCPRCIDRAIGSHWPRWHTPSDEPLPGHSGNTPNSGFRRWNRSPVRNSRTPAAPAFDILAQLDADLGKALPCPPPAAPAPSTSVAPPVATSITPVTTTPGSVVAIPQRYTGHPRYSSPAGAASGSPKAPETPNHSGTTPPNTSSDN